ncbi:MAG: DUF6152 family protein [Bryobacteraceae bacterium]
MRTAVVLIATAMAARAHHSLATEYDRAVQAEYKATVTTVTWMNPHATFTASVTLKDGSTATWTFEMRSPNSLLREGWTKESLRPNEIVTVTAYPAKDGSPKGSATKILWADGHSKDCADNWMWGTQPLRSSK